MADPAIGRIAKMPGMNVQSETPRSHIQDSDLIIAIGTATPAL